MEKLKLLYTAVARDVSALVLPTEWMALTTAAVVNSLQVPVEIPTTVIGLVGLVIVTEAGIIYFLLRQFFELANRFADVASKSAEGDAAVAGVLREIATAVQQGRDVDALRVQIEELSLKIQAPVPSRRSRKSQA